MVEPAFDADRRDWQIVKRGVVNTFDSAIPGRNVGGRECPFRLHPPGDQRSQPQTDCLIVVMVLVEADHRSTSHRQIDQCVVVYRYARGCDDIQFRQELASPHLHLLLCGPPDAWAPEQVAELASRYAGLLRIQYLTRRSVPDAMVDSTGETFARLGVDDAGQYLVRPDGHVGFRCQGRDLRRVTQYLEQWFVSAPAARDDDSPQPL